MFHMPSYHWLGKRFFFISPLAGSEKVLKDILIILEKSGKFRPYTSKIAITIELSAVTIG